MKPLIELREVGVCYGSLQALKNVNLKIEAGQAVALVGANGSGKSTLLRVLHGLVKPTSGECTSQTKNLQAMLFQRPFMLRASALNNVALGLWLRGERWASAQARAQLALQRVELADRAQQSAPNLSSGQQQRLALARAWALSPDVLLLDEPTASLDPHAKREVEQLMAEFAGAKDNQVVTIIFASHNLGQVKRLATRVIYIEQGCVLADLPTHEFFDAAKLQSVSQAAHLFVKGELV
jgi:tungstate transport system ATP-binding protein